MDTKEFTKLFASKLVIDYPQAKTVQDLIEIANAEGRFEDETEMLSVWGRVCRLLPQKENN